jgi:hypothetical protein
MDEVWFTAADIQPGKTINWRGSKERMVQKEKGSISSDELKYNCRRLQGQWSTDKARPGHTTDSFRKKVSPFYAIAALDFAFF